MYREVAEAWLKDKDTWSELCFHYSTFFDFLKKQGAIEGFRNTSPRLKGLVSSDFNFNVVDDLRTVIQFYESSVDGKGEYHIRHEFPVLERGVDFEYAIPMGTTSYYLFPTYF